MVETIKNLNYNSKFQGITTITNHSVCTYLFKLKKECDKYFNKENKTYKILVNIEKINRIALSLHITTYN